VCSVNAVRMVTHTAMSRISPEWSTVCRLGSVCRSVQAREDCCTYTESSDINSRTLEITAVSLCAVYVDSHRN
jgi:hypothetical protein